MVCVCVCVYECGCVCVYECGRVYSVTFSPNVERFLPFV